MTGDNANPAQAAPSLQIDIARERLGFAAEDYTAGQTDGLRRELERAALAYAVAVLDTANRSLR